MIIIIYLSQIAIARIFIIQGGREISAIIITDDIYVIRNQKVLTTFFLMSIFNELFKFKTSDERQH